MLEVKRGLEFLKTYGSKKTVETYRLGLRAFLSCIYGKEVRNGDLDRYALLYVEGDRDWQDDLDTFLASLQGRPPKTIRVYLAAVKTYLMENQIEIPQVFWRRLNGRIKGNRPVTIDKVPSNQELKRIVGFLPIQGRALYLALESSGMRIGEGLAIRIGDIDLSARPYRVNIRGEYTKTGNPRVTFISSEAKEALDDWLRNRDSYLRAACAKSRQHAKREDDPRIFPFDATTAYAMWDNALQRAGLQERDQATGINTIHPHVLRKFFRTRLGSVIPVDIVEALMGHEGYLTQVYRRYSIEDLAEFYKKGEYAISVFGNGAEIVKIKAELDEKSKALNEGVAALAMRNTTLETKLEILVADNEGLKTRVAKLERTINEVLKDLKAARTPS